MCRCTIVVFLDFSRCFLMSFSVTSDHVFRKPCLIASSRLTEIGLKVLHVKTVLVLVWMFVTECYLPQFLFVMSPGALLTFQFTCFWCVWLFLFHSSGLTFLVCLVWWWIHHHIKLLMILMGLSTFWVKFGSTSLALLYLLAGFCYMWVLHCDYAFYFHWSIFWEDCLYRCFGFWS